MDFHLKNLRTIYPSKCITDHEGDRLESGKSSQSCTYTQNQCQGRTNIKQWMTIMLQYTRSGMILVWIQIANFKSGGLERIHL